MCSDKDGMPLSDAEVTLVNVWSKLFSLNRAAIQRTDSFFGLGGDSLLAIQLSAYLRTYGYYLTVSQIFSEPVLFQMARNMVKKDESKNLEANKCSYAEPFDLLKSAHETSLSIEEVLKETLENYNINIDSVEDVYPASPLQESVVSLILQDKKTVLESIYFRNCGQVRFSSFQGSMAKHYFEQSNSSNHIYILTFI